MTFYVIRRVFTTILVLLFMSFAYFALTRITPGVAFGNGENPRGSQGQIERRLHSLGLDQPWLLQYPGYLNALLHGDLGESFAYHKPVAKVLIERVPNSVLLLGVSLTLSLLIAIPLGVLAATRQYSKLDMTTSIVSYVGVSMPSFVLGIFLLLAGGVWLRHVTGGVFYFPLFGMHATDTTSVDDLIWHMVLPVTSLSVISIARFSRFTRSSMLEVLHQDFVRTARAKGVADRAVVYKHALRNALIPVVAMAGTQFVYLIGGAVIIEEVFALPGMGRLVVNAIYQRDYTMIQGAILLLTSAAVLVNLALDLLYHLIDRRILYA